ncbi:MAG: SGNH/GDSL hydrolase family protein [Planctomycetota bacterium]
MRKLLTKLAVALVALPLAVGAAEGLIYALDPHGISDGFNGNQYREELLELVLDTPRIYRHLPAKSAALRGFDVSTDSRGCRGPARDGAKAEATKRMLFLGDSVVFGWGVSDEDTFVALVEPELRAKTDAAWETVNLGHMMYDTTQELAALEEVGFLYEPDVVVLVFVDNDIVLTRGILEGQARDPLEDPNVSEDAKRILRMSTRLAKLGRYLPYTAALLQYHYIQSHPVSQTGSTEHAVELGLDVEAGWEACRQALTRIRALCEERGVPFFVLDYYTQDMLREFCAESGIPYGSIAFTDEETATGIRNSDSDAHANENGHRILTGHIVRELERLRAF